MSKKTFFYLKFEETKLKVLSVKEKSNGELIVLPAAAYEYSEEEIGNGNEADKLMLNQHYTVHNSDKSEYNNNYINHTIDLDGGEKKSTKIVSKALKVNNLFVPLYAARAQDLTNDRYHIIEKDSNEYIDLGEYLPKKTTLFFMVVIGVSAPSIDEKDLNSITVKFKRYSLTLFWSFGHIPSHTSGMKYHFLTVPDQYVIQQLTSGYNAQELVTHFRLHRKKMFCNFIDFISKLHPNVPYDRNMLKVLSFKKSSTDELTDEDDENIKRFLG